MGVIAKWESVVSSYPAPFSTVKVRDEEGLIMVAVWDGIFWHFPNGGTGNAICEWLKVERNK